jgi:anti-sigma regulatory factor (Ser/Thr protein kinase)
MEEDDVLLLFTDGLIERKDRSLQESLAQLLRTAQHPADRLEQRLDHLLTHSSADTDDDTCIVGIHVLSAGPGRSPLGDAVHAAPPVPAGAAEPAEPAEPAADAALLEAAAPPLSGVAFRDSADYDGHPSAIAAARAFVTDFIERAHPSVAVSQRQHGAATLVTSELVTNAVRHAASPFRLRLALSADVLEIAVSDASTGHPVSQPHDPARIGQHGMEIVLALCRSLHVERSPTGGKTVVARLATQ